MFFMFPSNLEYGGWRCSSVDRLLAYHGRNLGVSLPEVPRWGRVVCASKFVARKEGGRMGGRERKGKEDSEAVY